VLGGLNWSQIPIVHLIFGRSNWTNEHDDADRGGAGRLFTKEFLSILEAAGVKSVRLPA
jgi:hypothetical protein